MIDGVRYSERTSARVIQYDEIANCRRFSNCVDRDEVGAFVDDLIIDVVSDSRINYFTLRKVLGLTSAEAGAFAEAVLARGQRSIDANHCLEKFRERCLAGYAEVAPKPVEWWFIADPSCPFTVSRQPLVVTDAEWYGAAYEPTPSETNGEEYIEILQQLAGVQRRAPASNVYDTGSCALCLSYISLGERNSITLGCGHIFHWSAARDCDGLIKWFKPKNNSGCPVCRTRVVAVASTKSLPLHVNWPTAQM